MLHPRGGLRCGSQWGGDYDDIFGRDVDAVSYGKEGGKSLE